MIAPSYDWDFWFLWQYRSLIALGLGVTILYTIGTILLGLAIGLLTGLLRLSRSRLLNAPLVAYVEIFRCTPLLVQIIWLKNTSLVSTIAVADLLYAGQMITATTYRPLEVYTMVAVVYFLVLFPLTVMAQGVERRLARAD